MTEPPPELFAEFPLVCWSAIDERHLPTGNCQHLNLSMGERDPVPAFVAITIADDSFYLMRFNAQWEFITDTWHDSVAAAQSQAEFEYSGVSETWRFVGEQRTSL